MSLSNDNLHDLHNSVSARGPEAAQGTPLCRHVVLWSAGACSQVARCTYSANRLLGRDDRPVCDSQQRSMSTAFSLRGASSASRGTASVVDLDEMGEVLWRV